MMLRRMFRSRDKTEVNGSREYSSNASKLESEQTSIMSVSPSVASSVTLTDNASGETASLASTIKAEAVDDSKELKARNSHKSPTAARSTDPPSIRLCKHETLPFDRAYRIVNLPNFKKNTSLLDALGAKQIPQHSRSSASQPYVCTDVSGATARCNFKYAVHPDYDFHRKGMILQQTWTKYGLHKDQTQDRSTLQAYLSNENDFAFCPHLRASSDEVVDRTIRFVCPDAVHPDPVEEWLISETRLNPCENLQYSCAKCNTKLTFHGRPDYIDITARRLLGECGSPKDNLWLQQCEQANNT